LPLLARADDHDTSHWAVVRVDDNFIWTLDVDTLTHEASRIAKKIEVTGKIVDLHKKSSAGYKWIVFDSDCNAHPGVIYAFNIEGGAVDPKSIFSTDAVKDITELMCEVFDIPQTEEIKTAPATSIK
jgi:hypothetical protein